MSAFAKVTTQIKDLTVLKKSLTDLGLSYETGAKGVHFYGAPTMDVDVYVKSKKFGFVRNAKDDSYDLVADSDFKTDYNKLRQKYSENVTRQMLTARGYTVAEVKTNVDGEITIVAKRCAYA